MRRLAITIMVTSFVWLLGASIAGTMGTASASAASSQSSTAAGGAVTADATTAAELAPVDVLQVTGLFDEIIVRSIEDAIARSEGNASQALILQMDTSGSVVSRETMQRLVQRVSDSTVPIGVWVGPARKSRAYGEGAQLMAVADVTAMVRGSRIGYIGEPLLVDGQPVSLGAATSDLVAGSMSFSEARQAGVLKLLTDDVGVPTMRNMVLAMDGFETVDGQKLSTVVTEIDDQGGSRLVATTPVFYDLGLLDRIMHTVAQPSTAYLLFIIGLALLIFEFFTAGVGVGGGVGAICAVLGCYGLAALPTRPVAIALILLAMFAFSVDVQVGIPRLWTGVGLVLFTLGSLFLFQPVISDSLRLGWLPLLVGIGGIALTFIVGMPSMVRTRFATPTIGREWMIGEMGTASTSISPDGVVLVSGARWRARTNRATPIKLGDPIRVVGIDGVTLDVEPEDGAARDYRERRPKKGTDESQPESQHDAATDPV